MSNKSNDTAGAKAAEIASDIATQAEEAFEAAAEAIEGGFEEAHTYVKRQWEERPLAVAGTALGVGLLLGFLLNSSRRR